MKCADSDSSENSNGVVLAGCRGRATQRHCSFQGETAGDGASGGKKEEEETQAVCPAVRLSPHTQPPPRGKSPVSLCVFIPLNSLVDESQRMHIGIHVEEIFLLML